jgi:dTDP-4-amino-4,6-dideoxygalactose transaminase
MFVIRLQSRDEREAIAKQLKERGIETGVHYPVPNHLQPAITELYGEPVRLPRTEAYVDRILSLPMFPSITEEELKTVCDSIKQLLSR